MRTVAIINQKGGCGKTTTSINLAACLARLNQKTLLVDMDPQGHCGVGLAVPEDQIERTIYDALIEVADGKTADVSQIVWQIASDFDLAPSSIRLAAFEQIFAHRAGRDERLRQALDRVRFNYQWCVIDCPPSVGLLTFNALKACDLVIVPVETGYFSLHGLSKMMETLDVMRNKCGKEITVRILPTLYDTRTKLAREVLSQLRAEFRHYLMESTVNFNTKLKEAASFGQPITEYDPGSRGYRDFVNLARELMGQTAASAAVAPEEKLSRPAELVQRAKQLAQFAHMQFNKSPMTPAVSKPAAVNTTTPPVAAPAAKTFTINSPPTPAPVATPLATPFNITPPPLPVVEERKTEIPSILIPPELTSGFETPLRLNAMEWLPEAELFIDNKPLPPLFIAGSEPKAGIEPKAERPPLVAKLVKTTKQKIEEFYGVKQMGADVLFAAHFDNARTVLVAGDFNNWSPQSTPMIGGTHPGDWQVRLPLAPGRYKYRLVVDGRWVTDPNNRYVEMNQFGELDNVIEVASLAAKAA